MRALFCYLVINFFCVAGLAINTTNEGYQLTTNTRKIIYANSICRVFMNKSTTKVYFIPTKTAAEFNSFINGAPAADIVVDTCRSCNDLKIGSGGTLASGVYEIDPDGTGGLGTVKFYCDMTTQGGGWTLVWSNLRGGTNKPVTGISRATATTGGVRCSTANSSTSDTSGSCSMISSNKEGFNYFIGLDAWNSLGRNKKYMEFMYNWSTNYGYSIDQETRFALQQFTSAETHTIKLTNPSQTVGGTTPGIYSYHNNNTFKVSADGGCPTSYSNTPFWYVSCWSGSMNGGGENSGGSYYNGAYWTSSSQAWGTAGGNGAGNGWMWIRESDYYSSCTEAKTIGGFVNSGNYMIDSDGPGGSAAVSTYCTM
ncbi:MAG: hypothetical protein RJB66_1549 [Pseudomonadota bacterium]|jgi:hypothetical protein